MKKDFNFRRVTICESLISTLIGTN